MENIMKKIIFGLLTLSIIAGFNIFNSSVACAKDREEGITLLEAIKNDDLRTSRDFDLNLTLGETERKLDRAISEKTDFKFSDKLSADYFAFLIELSTTNAYNYLGENESEKIEYLEFASIYSERIGTLSSDDATRVGERDILLKKKYNDIREENKQSILLAANMSHGNYQTKSSFNRVKATEYAKKYGLNPNNYYDYFPADCTNFTSQIAFAGGMRNDYTSFTKWYWDKKGVYSRSWTLAKDFAEYWTYFGGALTLQFTDRNSAQRSMTEGAFVAYWNRNTYQISHMAYVSEKKNEKAYVTQHSSNKVNAAWDSLDLSSYSAFILLWL